MFGQAHHFLRAAPSKIEYGIKRCRRSQRLYGVPTSNRGQCLLGGCRLHHRRHGDLPVGGAHEWHQVNLADYPNVALVRHHRCPPAVVRRSRSVPELRHENDGPGGSAPRAIRRTPPAPQTVVDLHGAAPAVQVDLYFGLATKGREIGEGEWAAFLSEEVTPRFPDGLSVLDVAGQYRIPSGRITRERSKLLVIIVPDAPAHLPKVQAIVDAYKKQFNQLSVLNVERAICAAF